MVQTRSQTKRLRQSSPVSILPPFWTTLHMEALFQEDGWTLAQSLQDMNMNPSTWEEEYLSKNQCWTNHDPHPRKLSISVRRLLMESFFDTYIPSSSSQKKEHLSPCSWNIQDTWFLQQCRDSFPWWEQQVLSISIEHLSPIPFRVPLHGLLYLPSLQQYVVMVETFQICDIQKWLENPRHVQLFSLYLFVIHEWYSSISLPIPLSNTSFLWIQGKTLHLQLVSYPSSFVSMSTDKISSLWNRFMMMLAIPEGKWKDEDPTFLYPNMKFSPFWYTPSLRKKKKQHAQEMKEWTLLPYINIDTRQRYWTKVPTQLGMNGNVFSNLSQGSPVQYFQKSLIDFQYTTPSSSLFYIGNYGKQWISTSIHPFSSMALFVDFEWVHSHLYLIGITFFHSTLYPEGQYRPLWASSLSPRAEYELVTQCWTYISHLRQQFASVAITIPVYFYFAEDKKWKQLCSRFSCLQKSDDGDVNHNHNENLIHLFDSSHHAYDFHHFVWRGPLLVRGCFTTKLKDVGWNLVSNGIFPSSITLWKEGDEELNDGASSMDMAYQYYQTREESLRHKITTYNRHDCQVLFSLWKWIQSLNFPFLS